MKFWKKIANLPGESLEKTLNKFEKILRKIGEKST